MISIKLTVDDVDLDLLGEMTWLSAFLATKLLFFLLFVHYPLEALKILFFFFWLCWVFVAARGLSLVAASGGYSSLRCAGFSLRWLLLLQSTGSR